MALVVTPQYPVEGEEITLSLTATSGTATVFELTAVPSASAVVTGLILDDVPEDVAAPTDALDAIERGYSYAMFIPDVAGEYSIRAYDIVEWAGVPSYPGDPAGERRYELADVQIGTVYVGKAVDLPILTSAGRGATLRLNVVNETVRVASMVDATDEWARIASLGTGVAAALTAFAGIAANSIGNDLATAVNDLRVAYEAHRVNNGGAYHANVDAINTVSRTAANSVAGALVVLGELYDAVVAHLENSTAAATRWHTGGAGTPADDYKNLPTTGAPGTLAEATVLCSDLRECCYERHRVQVATPACHAAADGTNFLSAPTVLDNIIVAYLDELATIAPAAVAGEPEGVIDARQRYGFI